MKWEAPGPDQPLDNAILGSMVYKQQYRLSSGVLCSLLPSGAIKKKIRKFANFQKQSFHEIFFHGASSGPLVGAVPLRNCLVRLMDNLALGSTSF